MQFCMWYKLKKHILLVPVEGVRLCSCCIQVTNKLLVPLKQQYCGLSLAWSQWRHQFGHYVWWHNCWRLTLVDVESTWSLLKHLPQPRWIQVKKLITMGNVWVSYNQVCVCSIQHLSSTPPPLTLTFLLLTPLKTYVYVSTVSCNILQTYHVKLK